MGKITAHSHISIMRPYKMSINAIYIAAWLSGVPLISLADTGFKNELDTYVINNGSAQIEHLGRGLMRELEKRNPHLSHCSYKEYASDAPKPIGDGKASNHIIIKCQDHADLGIRFSLRSSGKFRILGYWSANS